MVDRQGPVRTCRVCRQATAQSDLQRWVVIDGKPVVDIDRRQAGRGWYICSQPHCQVHAEQVILGQSKGKRAAQKRDKN